MRILAYLNRRYTPGEFVALLIPAVAVVLGSQIGLIALGLGQAVAAPISLAASLTVFFAGAALIDRRNRA